MKREEQQLLEAQSTPLRNYLMQNVMPTMTVGLIECCRVRPDDPIDFLVCVLSQLTVPLVISCTKFSSNHHHIRLLDRMTERICTKFGNSMNVYLSVCQSCFVCVLFACFLCFLYIHNISLTCYYR